MQNRKIDRNKTVRLATAGILTAIVILFQFIGASIKFGTFSVSLVLIPIVIGAALGGKWVSTWLGFVFSVVVLLSGDASAFLAIDPLGTVITVILKGTLAGFVGGLIFELLQKINTYFAVIVSAILVPVTNTGIFLVGCKLFFFETVSEWGVGLGFENTFAYMIFGLVGLNFIFELIINIVLSPSVVGAVKALKRKGNPASYNVQPKSEKNTNKTNNDKQIIKEIRMFLFMRDSGRITQEEYKSRIYKLFEQQ